MNKYYEKLLKKHKEDTKKYLERVCVGCKGKKDNPKSIWCEICINYQK